MMSDPYEDAMQLMSRYKAGGESAGSRLMADAHVSYRLYLLRFQSSFLMGIAFALAELPTPLL